MSLSHTALAATAAAHKSRASAGTPVLLRPFTLHIVSSD